MKLRKDPLLVVGIVFLGLLALFAIFGPTMRHHYLDQVAKPHLPMGPDYWFGTDELGRDIFARIAYGARISISIGLIVQAFSLLVGILMGVLGTFAPRWIRMIVLRLTDGMFAFPDILLAILIVGVLSTSKGLFSGTFGNMLPVILALAIASWPSITRLTVTQLASIKDREYVVAAKAMGASTFYLVRKHILPQLWGTLLAVSMVDLAGTILAESTLSFLGIGVRPPDPSWGSMINNARAELSSYPMTIVWPCLFLSASIFALNFVGDGLRAMLDPKSK